MIMKIARFSYRPIFMIITRSARARTAPPSMGSFEDPAQVCESYDPWNVLRDRG